jgi:hypothetical protein
VNDSALENSRTRAMYKISTHDAMSCGEAPFVEREIG